MTEINKNAIEVKNIVKLFEDKIVIHDATFKVKKGTIHGFIGPNGAGKTTILSIINRLVLPDIGEVYVDGYSVIYEPIFNKNLGYIVAEPKFPEIPVKEYTYLISTLLDISREKFIEEFSHSHLFQFRDKLCKDLSTGWKKILQFFILQLYKPKTIVADEPFNGLDPTFRKQLMNSFIKAKSEGRTVLLSTHILSDLEILADDITMIKEGKIIFSGPSTDDIGKLYDELFVKPQEIDIFF